jgi:hypothetical protein
MSWVSFLVIIACLVFSWSVLNYTDNLLTGGSDSESDNIQKLCSMEICYTYIRYPGCQNKNCEIICGGVHGAFGTCQSFVTCPCSYSCWILANTLPHIFTEIDEYVVEIHQNVIEEICLIWQSFYCWRITRLAFMHAFFSLSFCRLFFLSTWIGLLTYNRNGQL